MLLLRLSRGISSGFRHATTTPIFFRNCHCRKGHYASASIQPRYFFRVPPCQSYTIFLRNCHFVGRGHYASASTQSMYFLRVPASHPQHPIFFGIVIILGRGIMLLLRLSRGTSSGCHKATPTSKKFGIIIIVGRGIMPLLRLSQCISSGWHNSTPTPKNLFFGIVIIVARGIMLLLRLSQGISSGCHQAIPIPKNFGIVITVGRVHYASASTQQRYFFRVPPFHPYTQFFWNCHYCEKGHCASASTQPSISSGCHNATPKRKKNFGIVIIVGRGTILPLRLSQGISSGCHHAIPSPQNFFSELSLLW